jgi:protein O-mannosyl-transferase
VTASVRRTNRAVVAFLMVATFAVYIQVRTHQFVSYDDPMYVTQNPQVGRGLTADGLYWALTSGYAGNWHPLTWFTHMLDCQLWGMFAGAHLLVNACLHIASAVLLFELLRRMTAALWPSAFVAAVFALHPLRVESVAWVAERKDVLSTFFWMLTMWVYLAYLERPSWRRYGLLTLCYALGLMAKPMLVTLPFVLLLLDVWPLGRVRLVRGRQAALATVVLEKLPLMALAVASSVITLAVQRQAGAVSAVEVLSMSQRLANAAVAYIGYVGKLVWPVDLAALYPYRIVVPTWEVTGSLTALVLISACALWLGRRYSYVLVGWLWYLGTLVPVIGLVQVGEQAMADRYTYVPMIGLLVIIAWGVPDLLVRWRFRTRALPLLAGAAVAACAALTWVQVGYWKDSETLYRHALAVTTGNVPMHNNLGLILMDRGQVDEAQRHFEAAVEAQPRHVKANVNLAMALLRKGDLAGAARYNRYALQLAPSTAEAHSNLAMVLQSQGDLAGAEGEYREALRLSPGSGELHYNLGNVLLAQHRPSEAATAFRQALQLTPSLLQAQSNLAVALSQAGQMDDAIAQFETLLRTHPDYTDAQFNYAVLLLQRGQVDQAIAHLQVVVRLRPDFGPARDQLNAALAQRAPRPLQ